MEPPVLVFGHCDSSVRQSVELVHILSLLSDIYYIIIQSALLPRSAVCARAASTVAASAVYVQSSVTLAGVDRNLLTDATVIDLVKTAIAQHLLLLGVAVSTNTISLLSVNNIALAAPCLFEVSSIRMSHVCMVWH